jgi:dimeric dUTPase (all-alpha-NTP-PPase superfamily)
LNWKWWKDEEDNWDKFQEELIDVLHFLISVMSLSGMNDHQVVEMYSAKHRENHRRQDEHDAKR